MIIQRVRTIKYAGDLFSSLYGLNDYFYNSLLHLINSKKIMSSEIDSEDPLKNMQYCKETHGYKKTI